MGENPLSAQVGNRISLLGHFDVPVILEDVRPLGTDGSAGYECRVRLPDGALEEAVISSEEAASIFDAAEKVAAGRPNLGDDGRYQLDCSRVAFERSDDDEIDLDSGFLIIPKALPAKPVEPTSTTSGAEPGTGDGGETTGPDDVVPPAGEDEREVAFSFVADRNALYAAWNAVANLADVAGEVSISARAKPKSGFDKSKLENGVLEPLRELGLIKDDHD